MPALDMLAVPVRLESRAGLAGPVGTRLRVGALHLSACAGLPGGAGCA